MESHNPFHGSSHHQPDNNSRLLLTINYQPLTINFPSTIVDHQLNHLTLTLTMKTMVIFYSYVK